MSSQKVKGNNSTELLVSLANKAKITMQNYKFILESIQLYKNQINEIKNILQLNKAKNFNFSETICKDSKLIYQYIRQLKILNNNYSQEITILRKKIFEYNQKLFNIESINKPLENNLLDNFILKNALLKLNNEILRYNSLLKTTKKHFIFREMKRDSSIDKKGGEYTIDRLNLISQKDLLFESRNFNKCFNKVISYNKKIKEKYKIIEELKYYIENIKNLIFKSGILKRFDSNHNIFSEYENNIKKKNNYNMGKDNKKKFQEDEKNFEYNKFKEKYPKNNFSKKINIQNYNSVLVFQDSNENKYKAKIENNNSYDEMESKNLKLSLINKFNEGEEKNEEKINELNSKKLQKALKKKNNRIKLLSCEDLYDISNYEGKNEEIIDEELHSNDETKFESKILAKKAIRKDYLAKIKKEVPSLNFSQIEFNKAKVMNEADLYSLNQRNFKIQNIDVQIINMKKKIKKIKKKLELNIKKYNALGNFIEETKNYYNKILRPLKIKSTVEGGDIEFKIQNLLGKKDNEEEIESQNYNDEEELVGSDYSDEDKYELYNNQIHIIGDDSEDENNDNIITNTQAEIKTNIGLNLIDNGKRNLIKKCKKNFEDNCICNSN